MKVGDKVKIFVNSGDKIYDAFVNIHGVIIRDTGTYFEVKFDYFINIVYHGMAFNVNSILCDKHEIKLLNRKDKLYRILQ